MITLAFIWKESFRKDSTLGQAETKKSPKERSSHYNKVNFFVCFCFGWFGFFY